MFIQQLIAEMIYRAALLPFLETGSMGLCAVNAGMPTTFYQALRDLDPLRCGLYGRSRAHI